MDESNEHLRTETPESDDEELTNIRLPDTSFTLPGNGFHKTIDLCFSLIREAVFKNQWERAADLLSNYFQTLEDAHSMRRVLAPGIVWRLGNEILLNHPKSTLEDFNLFNERMKNIGVKNYLMISLEHAFYLMCNGMTDDAYRILSVAGSWRYGNFSLSQEKLLKLIRAYRGLIDYQKWVKNRVALTQSEMGYASETSNAQNMSSLYRQATASFQEVIKDPGVWDSFVLCYVDLLESSGKKEEVKQLLKDYAYNSKYPANPNALVYLYEFLKRNNASNKRQIKALKALYTQVPSHQLMFDFTGLLLQSESDEHHQLALEVIFNVLDFCGWKDDLKAWKCLAKQFRKALKSNHEDWVLQEWQSRKSWWPPYHFTRFHAKKDWKNDANHALNKALVAGTLLGPACRYFSIVCGRGSVTPTTKFNSMVKFVNAHKCTNPG